MQVVSVTGGHDYLANREGQDRDVVLCLAAVDSFDHFPLVRLTQLPREGSVRARFIYDNVVQTVFATSSFPHLLKALVLSRDVSVLVSYKTELPRGASA